MLRELKNNQRGIILITVLLIVIVMMIVTVTVISLNISQVQTSENEVRRLQAEILSMGGMYYTTLNQVSNSAGNVLIYSETLNNTTFLILTNLGIAGPGPMGTAPLNVVVTY